MKNDGTQPIFSLKDDLEAAEDSAAPCVAEKTEKEASEASVSTRLNNVFAARTKRGLTSRGFLTTATARKKAKKLPAKKSAAKLPI